MAGSEPFFPGVCIGSKSFSRSPVRDGVGHRVCSRQQLGDTCRNCEERGHWARECRTAEKYRDTPEVPRVVDGSVSMVTDGRNGVDMYLALRLNGRVVHGLLDMGCDTSVIESYRT